jgi:hypothetical protein
MGEMPYRHDVLKLKRSARRQGATRCGAYSRQQEHVMRILKAALSYFLIVFAAGFVLGSIRVPLLVPRLGVRMAELLEMPLMLAAILWASRRLARHHPELSRARRLAAGGLALGFMLVAELAVAFMLAGQSTAEYIASRDPVSGSAHLVSLAVFALAPALWPVPKKGRDTTIDSSTRTG